MSGILYTLQAVLTFNEIQDQIQIQPTSDTIIIVHSIHIGNLTHEGEAEEEIIRLEWHERYSTGGSRTPVPIILVAVPIEFQDPGWEATGLRGNNNTLASGGSGFMRYSWAWNVREPFNHVFSPRCRPVLAPLEYAVLRQPEDPSATFQAECTMVVETIQD